MLGFVLLIENATDDDAEGTASSTRIASVFKPRRISRYSECNCVFLGSFIPAVFLLSTGKPQYLYFFSMARVTAMFPQINVSLCQLSPQAPVELFRA